MHFFSKEIKKLHRFFEDLLTEEFEKIAHHTIPILGKNQPFRSTISAERIRGKEATRIIETSHQQSLLNPTPYPSTR